MKREKYIDVAKGFGILIVVFCHIISNCDLASHDGLYYLVNVIYSFHMPLFFFISGYCMGLKKETGEKPAVFRQIGKIARSLLLPYLVWSGVYMFISGKLFDDDKLKALFTGSGMAPLWFLATLGLCEIAFVLIRRVTYKMEQKPRLILLMCIAVSFLILTYILWDIKSEYPVTRKTVGTTLYYLYISVSRVCFSLPILILGYLTSQLDIIRALGKLKCSIIGTAALAAVFLIVYKTDLSTNLHMFRINKILILMCTSVLGAFGTLMLSYAIGERSRVLNYLGLNSLAIMVLHYPPLRVIAYSNNITRAVTNNPVIVSIVATVLTILISLLGLWLVKNNFFITKSHKPKEIK